MVTWQHLFRLLNSRQLLPCRWALELRAYLKVCGLDTFEGIGHHLAQPRDITGIRHWRERDDHGRWQNAMVTASVVRKLAGVMSWRFPKKETSTSRWDHSVHPRVIESARDAIAAWRVTSYDQREQRLEQRRRNR
jgi:hypothetical protein